MQWHCLILSEKNRVVGLLLSPCGSTLCYKFDQGWVKLTDVFTTKRRCSVPKATQVGSVVWRYGVTHSPPCCFFFIHKIRISVLRLILSTQFFTADGQTSVADKLSSYSIYVLFDKSMKFLPHAQHTIRFIFRYEGKSDLTYEDVRSCFDTQSRPCYAAAKLPYITNTILVTPAQITVLEKVVLLWFCCSTVIISSHASDFCCCG